MPSVSYISNGFCKEPSMTWIEDAVSAKKAKKWKAPLRGGSEMRFWNPLPLETTVRMRVYYSDKAPRDLPELRIRPEGNPLLVFPTDHTKFFKNCGAWGMRLVSDTPIIVDHIHWAGRQAPPGNVKYSGGVNDSLAVTKLSRLWYFGDGLALVWDPKKAPFPFNEFEWYHILNPNKRSARVKMKCFYGNGTRETHDYTVGAQRVLIVDNRGLVKPNNAFGIKFVSDQPIVVESERFIYGLHSVDEWGVNIHCPRPGVPAPLAWNEEDVAD